MSRNRPVLKHEEYIPGNSRKVRRFYSYAHLWGLVLGCVDDDIPTESNVILEAPDADVSDVQVTVDTQGLDDMDSGGELASDVAPPDAFIDDDPTLPQLDPEYVMNEVVLLAADEGFDLDDDGVPNNALSSSFSIPWLGKHWGETQMSLSLEVYAGETYCCSWTSMPSTTSRMIGATP